MPSRAAEAFLLTAGVGALAIALNQALGLYPVFSKFGMPTGIFAAITAVGLAGWLALAYGLYAVPRPPRRWLWRTAAAVSALGALIQFILAISSVARALGSGVQTLSRIAFGLGLLALALLAAVVFSERRFGRWRVPIAVALLCAAGARIAIMAAMFAPQAFGPTGLKAFMTAMIALSAVAFAVFGIGLLRLRSRLS